MTFLYHSFTVFANNIFNFTSILLINCSLSVGVITSLTTQPDHILFLKYLACFFVQSPWSNVIDPIKELLVFFFRLVLAAIVTHFLVEMIETLVVLEDKLELVRFHWLR